MTGVHGSTAVVGIVVAVAGLGGHAWSPAGLVFAGHEDRAVLIAVQIFVAALETVAVGVNPVGEDLGLTWKNLVVVVVAVGRVSDVSWFRALDVFGVDGEG